MPKNLQDLININSKNTLYIIIYIKNERKQQENRRKNRKKERMGKTLISDKKMVIGRKVRNFAPNK